MKEQLRITFEEMQKEIKEARLKVGLSKGRKKSTVRYSGEGMLSVRKKNMEEEILSDERVWNEVKTCPDKADFQWMRLQSASTGK